MRCLSCNVELTDKESTRKAPSGFYVDMCNTCFKGSDLSMVMFSPCEEHDEEPYEEVDDLDEDAPEE